MRAVSCREMRSSEANALAAGWTEERLLELAGTRLGIAIGRHFPHAGTAVAFLGKGHNAGDALVALQVLRDRFGWEIAIRNAFPIGECAPLTRAKWQQLNRRGTVPENHDCPLDWRTAKPPLLLIDGLLGIGGKGAPHGPLLNLIEEMRHLRDHCGARIAAVDLPSGIDADDGTAADVCVTADVTFMIGNAKQGLLDGRAANRVGALALVPIEALQCSGSSDLELICPQTAEFAKHYRNFDSHKGSAGHVGIIAGSERYPGAAAMAAIGALRGGAGLVTLHTSPAALPLIAPKCPPEVILRAIQSPSELHKIRCDALVIGCGLGTPEPAWEKALIDRMLADDIPAVIDADGLNLVARCGVLRALPKCHILTPHPGEFRRLAPDLADLPRESAVREFTRLSNSTLLLKGCRTLIANRESQVWCNSTGTPGMATGGQGDLLAGLIGALLAKTPDPVQSACLGSWIAGRAAEIALLTDHHSEESLLPTDAARHFGAAFDDWRTSGR